VPLEISEIGVRLTIGGVGTAPTHSHKNDARGGVTPQQEERIVAACVAEVMRTIRMSQER